MWRWASALTPLHLFQLPVDVAKEELIEINLKFCVAKHQEWKEMGGTNISECRNCHDLLPPGVADAEINHVSMKHVQSEVGCPVSGCDFQEYGVNWTVWEMLLEHLKVS